MQCDRSAPLAPRRRIVPATLGATRRNSRGGWGRRVTWSGRRSRGRLQQAARVRWRLPGNLRAGRGVRDRDAIGRRQGRTAGLSGGARRGRRCRVAGRRRIRGIAGRGLVRRDGWWLPHEIHRAVASARSGRDGEQSCEHENRERRCCHDGCGHDTCAHDKSLALRRASLVETRRAALRPRAPEALRVPRRAVIQAGSARLRDWFGSRQEIILALGHFSPSRHRLITPPNPRPTVERVNVVGASRSR